MFFVVYLTEVVEGEKHHVFPIEWMRDSENQLEKFVRMAINCNQSHIFFWSNEKIASDQPDTSVQPNFNLPLETKFPPIGDACFLGKTVFFRLISKRLLHT